MTAQQKKALRQEKIIDRIFIERDKNIGFRDPILGERRIEHAALLRELKETGKKKKNGDSLD